MTSVTSPAAGLDAVDWLAGGEVRGAALHVFSTAVNNLNHWAHRLLEGKAMLKIIMSNPLIVDIRKIETKDIGRPYPKSYLERNSHFGIMFFVSVQNSGRNSLVERKQILWLGTHVFESLLCSLLGMRPC